MIDSSMFIQVEKAVAELMHHDKIPGLSVAIVDHDAIVYAKGFGARNVDRNLPATPDTLFGIASVTKSFTCLAIMQLVEEQKLSVDDPVDKYLPFTLGSKDHPITIHHLMSHSSGIPNLGTLELVIRRHSFKKEFFVPITHEDDVLRFINNANKEIIFYPGEHFFYSNDSYTLLGYIIKKLSGMSFEEYIRQKILVPLQMTRSTLQRESFDSDSNTSLAYEIGKNNELKSAENLFSTLAAGPMGVFSSVLELTNYLRMYFHDGKFGDQQILQETLLKKMFTPYIERPQTFWGTKSYGYGWSIQQNFLGQELIDHTGQTGVSQAYLGFLPKIKIGIALTCNGNDAPSAMIGYMYLVTMMGKDINEVIPNWIIYQQYNKLQGKYKGYNDYIAANVIFKDDMLYLETEWMGNPPTMVPLILEGLNRGPDKNTHEFYIDELGIKTPVSFIIRNSGKIDLLVERDYFHKP